MKKILFVLLGMIVLYSCSNDLNDAGSLSEAKERNEIDEFVSELSNFNDSISHGVNSKTTRSWTIIGAAACVDGVAGISAGITLIKFGSWILGKTGGAGLHVVAAGVLAGSVVYSAAQSYMYYKKTVDEEALNTDGIEKVYNDDISHNAYFPSKILFFNDKVADKVSMTTSGQLTLIDDSVYSYMANLHNEIMYSLTTTPEDSLAPSSMLNVSGNNSSKDVSNNAYGIQFFSKHDIDTLICNNLKRDSAAIVNLDYLSILKRYRDEHIIKVPTYKTMRLFFEAFNNHVSSEEELNTIRDFYCNKISQSSIFEKNEKKWLISCIDITLKSKDFWEQNI